MGSRSRKRTGRRAETVSLPEIKEDGTPFTRSEKTELKNETVRAELEPLGTGERPIWVTRAAILAAILGVLNVGLYGVGVRTTGSTFVGAVVTGWILLIAAYGMWKAKYWAVLGFEVLLGITAAFAMLSLLVANSVTGAIRALLVTAVAGTFFWKLIRAMARIQMPPRPGAPARDDGPRAVRESPASTPDVT